MNKVMKGVWHSTFMYSSLLQELTAIAKAHQNLLNLSISGAFGTLA